MTEAGTGAANADECRWGCKRPHRARNGDRGPQPLDCYLPDPEKGFRHDPTNWGRRRDTKAFGEPSVQDDQAPVETANRITGQAVDRIEVLVASLREIVELLAEARRTGGDPEAIAAQIDAQLATAREAQLRAEGITARETLARRAAEDRATAAEAERDQLLVQTSFAEEDKTAAEAAAEQANAELANVRHQLDEALQRIVGLDDKAARLEAERDDARQAVQQASRQRDDALRDRDEARQRASDLSEQIRTLDTQLTEARSDASRSASERDAARTDAGEARQRAETAAEEARRARDDAADAVREAQARASDADAQRRAAERIVADRDQRIEALLADSNRIQAASAQESAELRGQRDRAITDAESARQSERETQNRLTTLAEQVATLAAQVAARPVPAPGKEEGA